MKHLKKLTREEKKFLKAQGFSPKEFLMERKGFDSYTFFHKLTKKLITIRR
ncbi:DUF6906 family protein [Haloimpatiens sp. FM7315]|uniref:DUF6906 family protein n=1 Tax=Haloimpatiens sp. FM7315 TaxID=3298609 RepID=UPI00370C8897